MGLGPWGLALLERLLWVAGRSDVDLLVQVVEPGVPGAGIFALDTPDYLPLNTPCGEHVMFPDDGSERPGYASSMFEWATAEGYRWVGSECRRDPAGRELAPGDFLPRRLMGEWLHWAYRRIVADRPPNVSVEWRPTLAVDVVPAPDGGELVELDSGETLAVDHVIVSTGHTPDRPCGELPGEIAPYPVDRLQSAIAPGDSVAVTGLGLVALDVIAALTVGRGGRYEEDGNRLRYVPSAREPVLGLLSRSGRPYTAKAPGATDPTGQYEPLVCTTGAAYRLRTAPDGTTRRRTVDFDRDFLPLIAAEMQIRYYRQCALLIDRDTGAADRLAASLADAWSAGTFAEAVSELECRYGPFDARSQITGEPDDYLFSSSTEYEKGVYSSIQDDAADSMADEASPLKVAFETVRALRDTMRLAIEFEGLDTASHIRFFSRQANRLKALVAGPPVRRSLELLALMDAGILRIPWGPSPTVEPEADGGYMIRSTCLAEPYVERVDHLVRGHLAEPTITGTRSPLIRNLARRGRIRPTHDGSVDIGGIALTEGSNPIGCGGRVQRRVWIFGPLTEGTRYFTQYVPSPRSRVRAFLDAEKCAEEIVRGTVGTDGAGREADAGRSGCG